MKQKNSLRDQNTTTIIRQPNKSQGGLMSKRSVHILVLNSHAFLSRPYCYSSKSDTSQWNGTYLDKVITLVDVSLSKKRKLKY